MWTVKQERDSNVHTIHYTYSGELTAWMLLIADWHYDNPKCRRDLLHYHLQQAKERNAAVCSFGDQLCLMQGKYDPRKSMEGLRPEHRKEDYLGSVIETTAKDLAPYASQLAVIGYGNHETNVLNRQGVDMVKWLCRTIREDSGKDWPFPGGYRGWINIRFEHAAGGRRELKKLHYFHGTGGGGAVTKGMIGTNRNAAMVDGADILVYGHVHEYWNIKIPKYRLKNSKAVEHYEQRHIQVSTYKDEINTGAAGWANEKGMPPKPLGGYWLKFTRRNGKIKINVEEAD